MTDEEFTDAFNDATRGMFVEEICNVLHIGRPTFINWSEGKNLPYGLVRENVIETILGVK